MVADDLVVASADDADADAVDDVPDLVSASRRRSCRSSRRVAGDDGIALRRERFEVEAVRDDAGPVVAPDRADDEQITAGVRARIAQLVVLGGHVGDHRVAGIALADVDPIGASRRVRMVEHPPLRVEREHAVVAVAVRGEIRAAVSRDAGPEQAVLGVVPHREVLDRDTIGAEDLHAVVALEVAVEDRGVAVDPAQHDALGRDRDLFVIHAR